MPFSASTELIDAARSGDRVPIERLLAAVWPDAYRLARAIVGEPQGAQDAAQEASIVLYRTITSLRSAEAFRVWFYRIVVRRAAAVRRRTSRDETWNDVVALDVGDRTAALDVYRAVSALPWALRHAVVLHYMHDLTSREIGAILGVPSATVRFRLMLAKRRLRPLLSDDTDADRSAAREVRPHAV